MYINDSNAERRNLTLLSLSIIIFYLADSQFVDGDVKLQILNVHFTNTNVLMIFVWILLFWFVFRYWVTDNGVWKIRYNENICDLESIVIEKLIKKIFIKEKKYTPPTEGKDESFGYIFLHGQLSFVFHEIDKTSRLPVNYIEIKGFYKNTIRLISTIFLFFTKPSLSTYFVPYFLFITACLFGLADLMKSILHAAS